MAEAAKITLSHKELELVCNTDWIFTKHTVIQKVVQLFGSLVPRLEEITGQEIDMPEEIFNRRPKISKGENYRLLPYVMLDYPRCFEKNDVFAIRTFFWWGNFFSITLQLSGRYKQHIEQQIENSFKLLQQNNYAVCINEDPWEHDFGSTNYIPVADLNRSDFAAILSRKPFIKLAKKIPLQLWETTPDFVIKSFEEIMQLIRTAYAPSL